jgi:hypothetical protein
MFMVLKVEGYCMPIPKSAFLYVMKLDLMGGSGDPNDHNYVKDGPFANWPVTDVLMNPDGTWRNLKTL